MVAVVAAVEDVLRVDRVGRFEVRGLSKTVGADGMVVSVLVVIRVWPVVNTIVMRGAFSHQEGHDKRPTICRELRLGDRRNI